MLCLDALTEGQNSIALLPQSINKPVGRVGTVEIENDIGRGKTCGMYGSEVEHQEAVGD